MYHKALVKAGIIPNGVSDYVVKMELLEQFKKNIPTSGLAATDQPTLLAVSGGLDSVVMAHLFSKVGLPFGIAHCNFQLRAEASEGDAIFIETMAAAWGVPFFVKRFETKTYASQQGISTQMAARVLRYEWFEKICREQGFARLATAHHLNDAVETALLNFVRGTGLKGLASLESGPSNRSLIRPLSSFLRTDIEAYAQAHQITWREDSSNATDDYARNFVRHHVMPLLTEMNPNFLRTAERNMQRLGQVQVNYGWLLERHLGIPLASLPVGAKEVEISKHLLRQLPAPRQALHELLRPYGFMEEQARQLAENLDHTGLELHADSGWRLLNDRQTILLTPPNFKLRTSNFKLVTISENDLMVTLTDGSRLLLLPGIPEPPFLDGRDAIVVDAEPIVFPLTLRSWQPGDWFQPFGMNGQRQKLQDFFVNRKLSRLDKERVWVLENGNGAIIWVLGHRMDERFRVSPDTKRVVKIGWTNKTVAP